MSSPCLSNHKYRSLKRSVFILYENQTEQNITVYITINITIYVGLVYPTLLQSRKAIYIYQTVIIYIVKLHNCTGQHVTYISNIYKLCISLHFVTIKNTHVFIVINVHATRVNLYILYNKSQLLDYCKMLYHCPALIC